MFRIICCCFFFFSSLFGASISVEEILLKRKDEGCNFTIRDYLLQRPGITKLEFLAKNPCMNDEERCFLLKEVSSLESLKSVSVPQLTDTLLETLSVMPHVEQVICESIDTHAIQSIPIHLKVTIVEPLTEKTFPRVNLEQIVSMRVNGDALTLTNMGMLRTATSLESIEIIGEAPLEFFFALDIMPSLKKIVLRDGILPKEAVNNVAQFKEITWSFHHTKLPPPHCLKKLHAILEIDILERDYSEELLEMLYQVPKLEHLGIAFPRYLKKNPFELIKLLSNLKSLRLSNIPPQLSRSIGRLSLLERLKKLSIEAPLQKEHLFWIKDLRNLEELTLQDCIIDGHFDSLEDNYSLRTLRLLDCEISDAVCIDIGTCRNIRTLVLQGGQYTNTGIAYISELTHLEHLSIVNNYITSQGVQHIAQIRGLKRITLIGVRFTYKDLANILTNSKVRWFVSRWYTDLWEDILEYFSLGSSYGIQQDEMLSAFCQGDSLLDGFSSDIQSFPIGKLYALKKYLSKKDLEEISERFHHIFSDSKPPSKVRLTMYFYALLEKAMQYETCRELFVPSINPFIEESL